MQAGLALLIELSSSHHSCRCNAAFCMSYAMSDAMSYATSYAMSYAVSCTMSYATAYAISYAREHDLC